MASAGYLGAKREYLRYDKAMEAGWLIPTGIIEGACRHMPAASRSAARDGAWTAPGYLAPHELHP